MNALSFWTLRAVEWLIVVLCSLFIFIVAGSSRVMCYLPCYVLAAMKHKEWMREREAKRTKSKQSKWGMPPVG